MSLCIYLFTCYYYLCIYNVLTLPYVCRDTCSSEHMLYNVQYSTLNTVSVSVYSVSVSLLAYVCEMQQSHWIILQSTYLIGHGNWKSTSFASGSYVNIQRVMHALATCDRGNGG
jgi:hypothetical protein